jgi:hypothetical protein
VAVRVGVPLSVLVRRVIVGVSVVVGVGGGVAVPVRLFVRVSVLLGVRGLVRDGDRVPESVHVLVRDFEADTVTERDSVTVAVVERDRVDVAVAIVREMDGEALLDRELVREEVREAEAESDAVEDGDTVIVIVWWVSVADLLSVGVRSVALPLLESDPSVNVRDAVSVKLAVRVRFAAASGRSHVTIITARTSTHVACAGVAKCRAIAC